MNYNRYTKRHRLNCSFDEPARTVRIPYDEVPEFLFDYPPKVLRYKLSNWLHTPVYVSFDDDTDSLLIDLTEDAMSEDVVRSDVNAWFDYLESNSYLSELASIIIGYAIEDDYYRRKNGDALVFNDKVLSIIGAVLGFSTIRLAEKLTQLYDSYGLEPWFGDFGADALHSIVAEMYVRNILRTDLNSSRRLNCGAINHTYTGAAKKTMDQLTAGVDNVYINRIYYNKKSNVFWWLNSKNYLHAYIFDNIDTNVGKFKGWVEYMLTDSNTLKDTGNYKITQNKQEVLDFIDDMKSSPDFEQEY
jgi:hypothetical protein